MTETMLLVFARSAGMVFRAPGFSHPSVPVIVRAGLALALALAIAPYTRAVTELPLITFVCAIGAEVCLGAAIGMGASVLYDGAYYAGRLLDDYVGVRGSVPNAAVASAQGFGRLWSSVFLAGFFLLDGYVPVVRAFAASFDRITPGSLVAPAMWGGYAIALPSTIVRAALLIAAPAVAVALIVQVALAAAGRVVPRFGNFTLAFPIVFATAVLVTIVAIPLVAPLAAHPWLVLPFHLEL